MRKYLLFILLFMSHLAVAQENSDSDEEKPIQKPQKIEIKPTARDFEIAERLDAILEATGWFQNPEVSVKEGVVFLSGQAQTEEIKKWASELAHSTRDVSAVVNKMDVKKPSIWNFSPILQTLRKQGQDLVRILPSFVFALLILGLTLLCSKLCIRFSKKLLAKKVPSPLLQDVLARGIGFLVFLFGFYVIFRILGLTTIAFTILGGTGALGIILGIAFRDITENLLASILLSIHHPFQKGDLIQIENTQGYVQRLTIRSTVLLSLDGNHIQVPNSTVYKNTIQNFNVNPKYQANFIVSIGFDESIPEVQDIILESLSNHPAILKDPEPWVLVENLENATVTLKVYFWVDSSKHSWLKVKSSAMRGVKRVLQDAKVQVPINGIELTMKNEVPVYLLKEKLKEPEPKPPQKEPDPISTSAEGSLSSQAEEISQAAQDSRPPERGETNLLDRNNVENNTSQAADDQ